MGRSDCGNFVCTVSADFLKTSGKGKGEKAAGRGAFGGIPASHHKAYVVYGSRDELAGELGAPRGGIPGKSREYRQKECNRRGDSYVGGRVKKR